MGDVAPPQHSFISLLSGRHWPFCVFLSGGFCRHLPGVDATGIPRLPIRDHDREGRHDSSVERGKLIERS